jgi:hypothetical protein
MARTSKPRFRLFISIFIFVFGLGIFFMVRGCTSDISPISANFLIVQNNKRFLYSVLDGNTMQATVQAGQTPASMQAILVYKDGDAIFLAPSTIDKLCAALRGDYTLHAMKDGSVDGYFTVQSAEGFNLETKFKNTQKLGEQLIVNHVKLENKQGKVLDIRWTLNPKTYEFTGLKNCEVHSFWIETNPSPGETVYSTTDYLVVPVKTLADFFGRKISFDPESALLMIE